MENLENDLAEVREELEDWRNAAKGAENPHPDEQHCTCVPLLHKQLKDARLREALNSFDAIDKERNDALKTCMTLLENMHANRNQHKVAAYTDEIEAAMAQIKTCYDPHA